MSVWMMIVTAWLGGSLPLAVLVGRFVGSRAPEPAAVLPSIGSIGPIFARQGAGRPLSAEAEPA